MSVTSESLKLSIYAAASGSLSEHQRIFNSLVLKVSSRREQLAAWDTLAPQMHAIYLKEVLPRRITVKNLSRTLLLKLDAHAVGDDLSQSERRTIAGLILDLLRKQGEIGDDAELKAIFNRYGSADYDEEMSAGLVAMKADFEHMFGESLGDDINLDSQDELVRRIREKISEQQARQSAKEKARQERKTSRTKANKNFDHANAGREELKSQLAQSLREIYRRLASALHPDRETDPALRVGKTELMQSLNQAYEKQDLLHMLELQIQLQQMDQHALNAIDGSRLQYYNKLLKEQVADLDQEIIDAESRFAQNYEVNTVGKMSAEIALAAMESENSKLEGEVNSAEQDLAQLFEVQKFKRWLKEKKKLLKQSAAY